MADNARGYRESLIIVLQKWGNSRAGMSGSPRRPVGWNAQHWRTESSVINKVGAPGFGGATLNKCRSGCRFRQQSILANGVLNRSYFNKMNVDDVTGEAVQIR